MNLGEYNAAFRDPAVAKSLLGEIRTLVADLGPTKLMHVCGSHEHEIVKHGLRSLLPDDLRIVPGPGCPVCVCPVEAIDQAITLSYRAGVTVLSFGDMIQVPATRESLAVARSNGGSLQVVYGPLECLKIARERPDETFVFFSVGFETTVSGVAAMVKAGLPPNLYLLVANRYMPPVLHLLMDVHDASIRGFLLPGHAAAVTGLDAYRFMEDEFELPCVVTGFEPVDLLLGIRDVLAQAARGEARVGNAYRRVVRDEGNPKALAFMDEVFERRAGVWRGIDIVDDSAFHLREAHRGVDALVHLDATPPYPPMAHPAGCQCHRVMLGEMMPPSCKMYKTVCRPEKPYGPCMVSMEGTCRSWYTYAVE